MTMPGTTADETIGHRLRQWAANTPERTAFIYLRDGEFDEIRMTYKELDDAARKVAALLRDRVGADERVLLLFPSGLEYITAFFGCLYAGVIAVPAYPPELYRLHATLPRLRAIVQDCNPAVVLTTSATADARPEIVRAIPELVGARWLTCSEARSTGADYPGLAAHPDGPAFIQYTSGSTGSAKGVLLSNKNIIANQRVIEAALGLRQGAVAVGWLPLYHDMGLIGNVMHTVYVGMSCVLMAPMHFAQRPVRWLNAITRFKADASAAPDFGYALCVRKTTPEQRMALDLSSWHVALSGAEPPRASTLHDFARTFAASGFRSASFRPCYGLAEATLMVSCGGTPSLVRKWEGADRAAVSSGRPITDTELRIVDPELRTPVGDGQIGEIWVRGASVARGYWNHRDLNAQTFEARLADGTPGAHLRTGDLGMMLEGELFVVGRLKETIIVRGRKIHPHDVEETVERSSVAVRPGGAVAFGVEHDGGEALAIVAAVGQKYIRDEEDREVLHSILRAVTEFHGVEPLTIVLVAPSALLKTSSGKVRRSATRGALLEGILDVRSRWERPQRRTERPVGPVLGVQGSLRQESVGTAAPPAAAGDSTGEVTSRVLSSHRNDVVR